MDRKQKSVHWPGSPVSCILHFCYDKQIKVVKSGERLRKETTSHICCLYVAEYAGIGVRHDVHVYF